MTRFVSNSYGLFLIVVLIYAIMQNSLFVIYIVLIAGAAGLHYIEANRAGLFKRFGKEKPLGFIRIANGLHILANILLAVLAIRELSLII